MRNAEVVAKISDNKTKLKEKKEKKNWSGFW